MKRLLSILILGCYLLAATEAKELLKLPMLFEHFANHKKLDGKMDMWEFLCMHYAHGNVRDADYEQDMKLPFKTSNTNYADKSFNFVLNECVLPKVMVVAYHQILIRGYIPVTFSRTLESIWQPPKFC